MFIPSFAPRGELSLLFRRMEGRIENFTPGDKIHPWGTTSPLWFAPRREVKNRLLLRGKTFWVGETHSDLVGELVDAGRIAALAGAAGPAVDDGLESI
jgi:hypothetical protein